TAASAPVGEYRGDARQAFWFFDEETVRATETYESRFRGLKPQLVGYIQDGKMVPQTATHLQINLNFKPESDGITFKLPGVFYDTVPSGSPRLTNWTQLPTNAPLGHASTSEISIDPICGPVRKLSKDVFSVHFQRETLLSTNVHSYELV